VCVYIYIATVGERLIVWKGREGVSKDGALGRYDVVSEDDILKRQSRSSTCRFRGTSILLYAFNITFTYCVLFMKSLRDLRISAVTAIRFM